MNAKDLLDTIKIRSLTKLFNDNNLPETDYIENETINLPKYAVIDFSNDYKILLAFASMVLDVNVDKINVGHLIRYALDREK